MDASQWNVKEINQLKKKKLIQDNSYMLLVFVLLVFFTSTERHALLLGVLFGCLWISVGFMCYTLKTGKPIGTKTSKCLKRYDRYQIGEKRWRRNKTIEIFFVSAIAIGIGLLLLYVDFTAEIANSPRYYFPFFGSWIGFNLGGIIRLNHSQNESAEQPSQESDEKSVKMNK